MFDAEPGIKERSINRNKYTSMIKESSKTAQRDLQDLVKKGIIVPLPERGRSTRYTLKLQEFTQAVTRVELVAIAKEFPDKYNVSAAIEYLSYEGTIKKITDRLLVQQIAKNHLIVHRRDQLANKILVRMFVLTIELTYINHLYCTIR